MAKWRWREDSAAIGLALLLALIVTWPLAANFTTQVPGDLIADRDQNLWNLWWVKTALLDAHNPYNTPLLYYPDGVDLYAHTLALPNGLIGLLPQLLSGLPAAYNTVLLFALVLAIYGGFRFVRYWLQRTSKAGDWPVFCAALAGGIAFGLNAYSLDALKGQTEVLSIGWLPLFAEAWLRAWDGRSRRAASVAGLLFGLTLLTSLYYAVYLALFVVGFLVYVGWRYRSQLPQLARRTGAMLGWAALGGLIFVPYLIGLAASILGNNFELSGAAQQASHSADLLGFFAPPRDHPLLGGLALDQRIQDFVWLGWVAPLLALLGLLAQRRRAVAWALAAGALGALLLALGSPLVINGNNTGIKLPWALLDNLPVFGFVGKVERFEVLARLLAAPLIGWGALALVGKLVVPNPNPFPKREGALGAQTASDLAQPNPPSPGGKGLGVRGFVPLLILILLLIDVPFAPQPTHALEIPAGFAQIRSDSEGGLLEVPLASGQVQTMGERMLYQTAHGWPIIGGYLARTPRDPLPECAPVWSLITWQPGMAAADVISPHIMADPLAVMRKLDLRYYAVYNYYDPALRNPLRQSELAAFNALAAATSEPQPVFADATVSVYRVRAGGGTFGPALQLGGGWGGLEKSGDLPFRWLQGDRAAVCIEGAAGRTVRLQISATSFAQERTLEILLGGSRVLQEKIPANGTFVDLSTAPLAISGDAVGLEWRVLEGSASPADLGLGGDTRQLSIGVSSIRMELVP